MAEKFLKNAYFCRKLIKCHNNGGVDVNVDIFYVLKIIIKKNYKIINYLFIILLFSFPLYFIFFFQAYFSKI